MSGCTIAKVGNGYVWMCVASPVVWTIPPKKAKARLT